MKMTKRSTSDSGAGIFFRQMAAMVAAGVPVNEALGTLSRDGKGASKVARSYLGENIADNDLFQKVFQYLSKHKQPNKHIADILYKVADEIDKYREFKIAFSQIFFIPVMTLVISAFLLSIMFIFVLPVWREMFEAMADQLPGPTLLVMSLSKKAAAYMHYIILLIAILGIVAVVIRKNLFNLLSRLPVVHRLFKHQSMVRFTRYMAVMLHIDMPLQEAASLAADEVRNPAYASKIKQAVASMTEKGALGYALHTSGLITPVVSRIIHTGEKSGTLAQTLTEVSVLYEKEADISLTRTVYWLDILIKFMVGVIVGFVVLSMYLPIFQMAGAIG